MLNTKMIKCPKCNQHEDVIGMDGTRPADFSNPYLDEDQTNKNYDFYYCKKCDVAFDE